MVVTIGNSCSSWDFGTARGVQVFVSFNCLLKIGILLGYLSMGSMGPHVGCRFLSVSVSLGYEGGIR